MKARVLRHGGEGAMEELKNGLHIMRDKTEDYVKIMVT